MVDYAIGDIQGCYDQLQHLLTHINFNDRADRLWLVGDLINRGPKSLEVLEFVKNLPIAANITLGNHEIYFLNRLFGSIAANKDDGLETLLGSSKAQELGRWLSKQPLLAYSSELNIVMCHAGIAPQWSLTAAKRYANEVEKALATEDFINILPHLYGDEPCCWSSNLRGVARLRAIVNYFTRMRFCNSKGGLNLSYKGPIKDAPDNIIPWFAVPNRKPIAADIVFGHWSALRGHTPCSNLYALDTGCLWGDKLTALRLQDRHRFAVAGLN